jgi:hypothetical protein
MFLTLDEIRELTGRIQRNAQARELDAMGIPYKRLRDGRLVVLRLSIETVLGVAGSRFEGGNDPQLNFS